ncbi:MAG TPA: hypothetical protein VG320_02450 [Paraburkholderia sp.]|jgi:hypothetical protein|uniref:hypothetical protein n=1 Tax=Paraburkholderia sp. TaxID=1926495 RepID=UPI002DF70F51|nr:hypothetical protein [Paraburkholderia sp.]
MSMQTLVQLLEALAEDREDVWPLYEEIGRAAVRHLLRADCAALTLIGQAWLASEAAQGALADSWPDAADHADIEARARNAEAVLAQVVHCTLFGDKAQALN